MISDSGSYQCITCSECSECLADFSKAEFHAMIADAKARQWTFDQENGAWEHYCTTCRPPETGLQRARRLLGL